jgi:hypothetical protein
MIRKVFSIHDFIPPESLPEPLTLTKLPVASVEKLLVAIIPRGATTQKDNKYYKYLVVLTTLKQNNPESLSRPSGCFVR